MDKVDLRSLLVTPETECGDLYRATELELGETALLPPLTTKTPARHWIDPSEPLAPVSTDVHVRMAQALGVSPDAPPPSSVSEIPSAFSALLPSLVLLKSQLLAELEGGLIRLLSLNPSRREAISQYLDRLAAITPGPTLSAGIADAAAGLRRWVEGPRTPAQQTALRTYFEEVALITLGQAVLLKAWSDRAVRPWTRQDLGRLNWALSTALKPQVPLDREGWQITRPNLYSWYVPSPRVQEAIWTHLDGWRMTDEGPGFLISLLTPNLKPEDRPSGYDSRFFKAVWEASAQFPFASLNEPAQARRNRVAFSPTLRDGAMVRTGPVALSWIGTERSLFHLLCAELAQLWWGPSAPPLWALGNGLDVHSRDQLALALTSASKPSLPTRIAEMEACDIAFVLEEQLVRGNGRNEAAQRLREQVEALPYFKKLRRPATSQGALQACVALSKLRPGGLLWWAREEALTGNDGPEMLSFLLERAKILCEWDFSGVRHSLPASLALFPKHLYLLCREPKIEARLTHRPLRVALQGQIRSHVELSLLFRDSFEAIRREPEERAQFRGQWSAHLSRSPSAQKEWDEHWPDPSCKTLLQSLDRLRMTSLPLAHAATIARTPAGDPKQDNRWSIDTSLRGFWLDASYDSGKRVLEVRPLPRGEGARGDGFLILVPDETWIAPLAAYLQSAPVVQWLDHHAERKGNRWILDEQTIKWIPIPKALLRAVGVPITGENPDSFAQPLPGEWEKLASEVGVQAAKVREAIQRLPKDEAGELIRAQVFVRASRALEQLKEAHNRLLSVVEKSGKIRWRSILDILPRTEMIPVTLHPRVSITGNLPLHIPVGRIDRVSMPAPGVLLATEFGFSLHLGSDSPSIVEMLWEQLDGVTHPTWSELTHYLRLPRRIELAESTAAEVLKSHGDQSGKLNDLVELLSACSLL